MNRILVIVLVGLLSHFSLQAQQHGQHKHQQGQSHKMRKGGWEPLMAMREVMQATFHPMLENNMQPARQNAALMLEKAKALAATTDRPAMFRGEAKDRAIKEVLAKTEIYANKVSQNASDEEVKIALSTLHGDFASLMPEKMKRKMHRGEKKSAKHHGNN